MMKLFKVLIGCTPKGRHIEQHDICFGIATSIKEMIPQLQSFWPEVANTMHVDGYRTVTSVDGYAVSVVPLNSAITSEAKLFFINLGGYKPGDFEEYHYKMIVAATDKGKAVQHAKQSAFYKHTGFKGAESHIDDKYGIDVDDVYAIEDIIPASLKSEYKIVLQRQDNLPEDELHLGYFQLKKL